MFFHKENRMDPLGLVLRGAAQLPVFLWLLYTARAPTCGMHLPRHLSSPRP